MQVALVPSRPQGTMNPPEKTVHLEQTRQHPSSSSHVPKLLPHYMLQILPRFVQLLSPHQPK